MRERERERERDRERERERASARIESERPREREIEEAVGLAVILSKDSFLGRECILFVFLRHRIAVWLGMKDRKKR